MNEFKQLLNWISEIITINDEKVDLGVDYVVNNHETVFHHYMALIIGSALSKSTSERMIMDKLTANMYSN